MRLGIGVPDKGYRLEGKIRNKGIMLVTHNLHLAEGSEISNETVFFQVARLIIFGESAILLDAAAKSGSILIGPGTALQQEGNGSSEMFIPVSITKGEIFGDTCYGILANSDQGAVGVCYE